MTNTNRIVRLINAIGKRMIDLIFSFVLLIITFPVIFITCILIRIESKGNPLYIQNRVGIHNTTFKILKLRTMYKDSSIDNYKAPKNGDPRVTKIGKIIRKLSIDELPQLINVLVGQMSLVGPRALPLKELELRMEKLLLENKEKSDVYKLWFKNRTRVKPGITGLAQAYGRSSLTIYSATEFDNKYALNNNIFLDIKIMIKTFFNALLGKGAN